MLLDAWVPTAIATEDPHRAVLRAAPVEGSSEVAVIIVRRPDDDLTDALDAELAAARQLRSRNVQNLLLDGHLSGGRHVLVTPAAGAVSLAERLHTNPPGIVDVLYALADIARGLSDIHRQGRSFGPLAPEHVLLIAGPTGRDIAQLPPVWWAWAHGFDPSPANPWVCPEPGGHPAARDAWGLAAIAFHALTGAPPALVRSDPALTTSLPETSPRALTELLDALLASPVADDAPDLAAVADRLDQIAHKLEGGSGPSIAPPMLLGTPVPVGGRIGPRDPSPVLRQPSSALPILPPDGFPITPPTPPPRLGIGAPLVPDAAPPPSNEEPLIPDEELVQAARTRQPLRPGTDLRSLPLLLIAGGLLVVVLVLGLYVTGLLG